MLAVLLAAAFFAAGCGSSSDASLSQEELVTQGDVICKKRGKDLETQFAAFLKELKQKKQGLTKAHQAEASETILFPILLGEAEELSELEAADDQQEQMDAIVASIEKTVEEGEGDPATFFETSGGATYEAAKKLAAEYGFTVCVQA
jgi:hypothetical protein